MKRRVISSGIRVFSAVCVALFLCGADRLRESRIKRKFVGEWEVVKDFSSTSCEADFMLRVAYSMTVNPDLTANDEFYKIPLKAKQVGPRRLVLRGSKTSLDDSCVTKRQVELTYPSGNSVLFRDKNWFICKYRETCTFSYSGKAQRVSE